MVAEWLVHWTCHQSSFGLLCWSITLRSWAKHCKLKVPHLFQVHMGTGWQGER